MFRRGLAFDGGRFSRAAQDEESFLRAWQRRVVPAALASGTTRALLSISARLAVTPGTFPIGGTAGTAVLRKQGAHAAPLSGQRGRPGLLLPSISSLPPLYYLPSTSPLPPSISPLSPLYLPSISPGFLLRDRALGGLRGRQCSPGRPEARYVSRSRSTYYVGEVDIVSRRG